MFEVNIKAKTVDELRLKVKDLNNKFKDGEVVESAVKVQELNEETVATPKVEEVNVATPVTQVATPVTDEVDSNGLPWDERIHASSKVQNGDGSWKKKRGVDKALVKQVEAELLGGVAPAPVVETPAIPVATSTPAPVVETTPAPAMPTPTLNAVGGHTVETFKLNFPMVMNSLITEGKITAEYMGQLATAYGVNQIIELSDDHKEHLFGFLVENGLLQQVG